LLRFGKVIVDPVLCNFQNASFVVLNIGFGVIDVVDVTVGDGNVECTVCGIFKGSITTVIQKYKVNINKN
jgi:hypothetical protein